MRPRAAGAHRAGRPRGPRRGAARGSWRPGPSRWWRRRACRPGPRGRAGCRGSRWGRGAAGGREGRLVEDLRDQAELLEHQQVFAVGDRHPGGFLTAVLLGEEPEIDQPGHVLTRGPHAEDSALVLRALGSHGSLMLAPAFLAPVQYDRAARRAVLRSPDLPVAGSAT